MVLDYQIIPAHVFRDRQERALAATRFFCDLYDGKLHDDEAINIWTINRVTGKKTSTLFRDFDKAGRFAAEQCDDCDVYFQVGVSNVHISGGQRFAANQTTGFMMLWSDIDIASHDEQIHKQDNLPPDLAAVIRIACEDFGLPPEKIINSGHGAHLYWPTRRLNPTEAALLELRLLAALRGLAGLRGWVGVDFVQDLARVMRVPGTRNLKDPEHPLDVYETPTDVPHREYDVAEIEQAIERTGFKPTAPKTDSIETQRIYHSLDTAGEADIYDLIEDQRVIATALAARNGANFHKLFDLGDTSDYPSGGHSSADFALLEMLAFWTNRNERQMKRLFERSALMRNKWYDRHAADGRSYADLSIANLLETLRNEDAQRAAEEHK